MSAYPPKRIIATPSPYDSNRKVSETDSEVANGTSKSRKNKSPYVRDTPPASSLSLDIDVDDCGHVDSETPEKRVYTPPSYLAKNRSTYSRYTDRKYGIPSPEPGRAVGSQYNDPPSFDLNHFMDTDSECGTPEKPVTRKR
jgi:hypothetical protein